MVARVYVSIGTNIDREHNVREGVRLLREAYGVLELSPVYETKAVGFDGDNFYNLVAAFDSQDPPERIAEQLHAIEAACGRQRNGPRFSSRTLDIDLLLYDDEIIDTPALTLPRQEITEHAFVLKPLADIAGERRHPLLHKSYNDLWRAMECDAASLWPVALPL